MTKRHKTTPAKPSERYYPSEGYIQLWRRFREHRFYYLNEKRPATREEAWIELLFLCAHSHRERYWHGVWVVEEPGDHVTSERELADHLRWGRKQLKLWLDDCVTAKELNQQRYQWGTRITVAGRAFPRTMPATGNQQRSHSGTTTPPPPETHQEVGVSTENSPKKLGVRIMQKGNQLGNHPKQGATDDPTDTSPTAPRRKEPQKEPRRNHAGTTSKEVKEGKETTPPDTRKRKQPKNSLPSTLSDYDRATLKAALLITEAHKRATGQIRPPSEREKERARQAVKAYHGDPKDIAEYVHKVTAEATRKGETPRSVAYGLAAWERGGASETSRQPERREPEPPPQARSYHQVYKPPARRAMTDDESKVGLSHIGSILGKLEGGKR